MKQNTRRNGLVLVVAGLAMMLLVVSASAQEEDTVYLPSINDGRVNNYDITAPVAIYDYYMYPDAEDVNAGVLNHIEFWGLDGQKVLEVTREEILLAEAETDSTTLVASSSGYSLYREADGSLTAVVGAYQFNWALGL